MTCYTGSTYTKPVLKHKEVVNSVCMRGVKGVFREEVIFEVHFKVSYISPYEKEMEDTARKRNSGTKFKKF